MRIRDCAMGVVAWWASLFAVYLYSPILVSMPQHDTNNHNQNPAYLIINVHGTFAANAPWCKAESPFSVHLRQNIEQTSAILDFQWSGKNTQRARLDASKGLAKFLSDLHDKHPNAKQIVIAHSHGGNVALYALKEITHLKDVSLITLATPFLTFKPRDIKQSFKTLPWGASIIAFLLSMPLLVVAMFILHFLGKLIFPSLAGDDLFVGVVLITGLYGVPLIFTLAQKIYKYVSRLGPKVERSVSDSLAEVALLKETVVPMLSISVTWDEARIWLRTSVIFAGMMEYVHRGMNRILTNPIPYVFAGLIIPVMIVAVIMKEVAGVDLENEVGLYSITVMHIILSLAMWSFFAFVGHYFLTLLLRSNPLFYGESVTFSLFVKTRVTATPPYAHASQKCYKVPLKIFLLRHSTPYLDPAIFVDIPGWIKQHCKTSRSLREPVSQERVI